MSLKKYVDIKHLESITETRSYFKFIKNSKSMKAGFILLAVLAWACQAFDLSTLIPESSKKRVKQSFKRFDKDKDGYLTV